MVNFEKEKKRRVVVTGLGVVSSIGIGWQEFWKNLIAGKSGISKITSFDTSNYDRHYGGEVKNFDPTLFMSKRKARMIGRSSQMAIATSKMAIVDSKLELDEEKRRRTAVCIGTTTGEIGILERINDQRFVGKTKIFDDELNVRFLPSSSVSTNVAIELKLSGNNSIFGAACSSGNYAIGRAYDLIMTNQQEYALAGGADAFSRILFTGFERLNAIAPEKCQPFDKNRKGMIPGEGAGIVFLETLESAKKRNAKIYAEILGYGLSCNSEHMTDPQIDGVVDAIMNSLRNSNIRKEEVDYISAHGTGTIDNDRVEAIALNKIFDGGIIMNIPINSIKSMIGHTMGAAAALGAIVCSLTITNNIIVPTINFQNEDFNCPIDCVPNKARYHVVKVVLNNSLAFGGSNASLVLGRVA